MVGKYSLTPDLFAGARKKRLVIVSWLRCGERNTRVAVMIQTLLCLVEV
jgi:hypothetical protein